MISLDELNMPIKGVDGLSVNREGFVFTSTFVPHKGFVYNSLLIRNPPNAEQENPLKWGFSDRSLEEHIQLINDLQLEKVIIVAESFEFITRCPSLRYVTALPASTVQNGFDYSPLYKMPCLIRAGGPTQYGGSDMKKYHTVLDYSRIRGLKEATVRNKWDQNFNLAPALESLDLFECKLFHDLSDVCIGMQELRSLVIEGGSVRSLHGITQAALLDKLSLGSLRNLSDMSELHRIAANITQLYIEGCPKIGDFSFLHKMTNMEKLVLMGNQTIPDLSFLESMPNLQYFGFSMKIQDGNLSRCLSIPHVHSHVDRRYYNLKNAQLPKGTCKFVI